MLQKLFAWLAYEQIYHFSSKLIVFVKNSKNNIYKYQSEKNFDISKKKFPYMQKEISL